MGRIITEGLDNLSTLGRICESEGWIKVVPFAAPAPAAAQ